MQTSAGKARCKPVQPETSDHVYFVFSKPKARDGSNPCSDNPSSEWNRPRQHPALKEHQQSCMYVYMQRVLTGFLSLSSQGSSHSSRVMWLRFETLPLHQDPEKSRDAEGVAAWMHDSNAEAPCTRQQKRQHRHHHSSSSSSSSSCCCYCCAYYDDFYYCNFLQVP